MILTLFRSVLQQRDLPLKLNIRCQ